MVAEIPCRLESDFLGARLVPDACLFGIHTQRALENFSLSGIPVGHFPMFVRALGMVKKAAAIANHALGLLPAPKLAAIVAAADEVIAGHHDAAFVVDVLQGGAGTSTNMNVNEVIANRGLELMGLGRGAYHALHPNDDVNLSQSTNDAYPTAARLAIILSRGQLLGGMEQLIEVLHAKGQEFSSIVTLGRTQLQDAVPIRLGDEFGAFADNLREEPARIDDALCLLGEVNLGGTAVGTRINADPRYAARAIAELSAISGVALRQSKNLMEASWDVGAFVTISGVLRRVAVKLSKICNDLRLLASGPRGGLNEIRLPPVQSGSSIMPGKVNPVIPEAVNQVCFQVIGNDLTVTLAAESGQLQLNAFEPLIVSSILSSMRLLGRAMALLAHRCVAGIEANAEQCRQHAAGSSALATALTPIVGYDRASAIAELALAGGISVAAAAVLDGLDPRTTERLLDPLAMCGKALG